jgi:hypothetical protein
MNYALRVITPVVVLTTACSSGFHPPPARPAAERSAQAVAQPAPDARAHDAHAHHAGRHQMPTSATWKPKPRPERTSAPKGDTAGEQARPALEAFGRAPLAFEAHHTDADVYVSHTPAYTLRIGPGYADILPAKPTVNGSQVRMRLIDANTGTKADAGSSLPGTVSYLTGNDPSQWRTAVATYAKVRYDAIYPGIDLVYYGTQREIEYDFVVEPGASPSRIALGFDGVDALALKDNGDLELTHDGQALVLRAPRAYQTIDGQQVTVDSSYRLDDDTRQVSFTVGDYNREQPLVIDPILTYAMSLGGVAQDEGNAVAVDAEGNIYVAGFTRSSNFPASGALGGHFDLFVTKLNSTGTVVLSSSFIGGSGPDETRGLAIDPDGNVYLSGVTRSTNFPTAGAIQATLNGESDAFVLKISTAGGGLLFSTYLGGAGLDEGTGVAIDAARNVYVTGATRSANFPTVSPRQAVNAGLTDSFVAKLNPAGSALLYSTYLGGSLTDSAFGIASDGAGNVTVVGTTSSGDFPTQAAAQVMLSGLFDAFVTRLSPAGALIFSTFLGGTEIDSAQAVTLDSWNRPILTGTTASDGFPVMAAAQPGRAGSLDAFVTGFETSGQMFLSTFLGGTGSDRGRGIARDAANRLYVIGQTFSADFPSVNPVQPKSGGNRDTFVVMLAPAANVIDYSTYLGGGHNDDGLGIAADNMGRAYVTGATMYAWPDLAGASDAFVMRLSSGVAGVDSDSDGMPDDWETKYSGEDLTPNDDLDGDGVSNLAEFNNHTHPLGFFTQYLAEGATGTFFDTQLALFNPGNRTAVVLLRFQIENQAEVPLEITLQPHQRVALNVDTIEGLAEASFATVAESDAEIVVDRTMTWDTNGFGSHAETAAAELSKKWFLAEGATHGTFDLYYLLQNPHPTETAHVTITYLRPEGQAPIKISYDVLPRGRKTINVDTEPDPAVGNSQPQNQRPLRATDVSAKITSDLPILVERAMYQTGGGRVFNAGHESMGVIAPSTSWFFAEGATGTYFDMYLLLANPTNDTNETDDDLNAVVRIDYFFPDGHVLTKDDIRVSYGSRKTLSVDFEDVQLANAAVSMRITSTIPIIAERAMWWPSPFWHESHNSAGSVVTSPRWAVAEGEVGGTRNLVTYVLIANTSSTHATVKVSPFYEDLAIAAPREWTIPPNSRFNVDMGSEFAISEGSKFSVLVEAQGPQELVVERAMYSNSRNVTWAAGTNALGTPLFPEATFIITPGGIFPKKMVVEEGTRVKFINRDNVFREMSSDQHPLHEDCPPINDASPVLPGQEKLTGNMVLDPGRHACGVHDHNDPNNDAVRAKIIVR